MNSSNGTWVKNMCQTFENIFMDVDKFVCKEPVLFVGNQMETVGENVKNFFSGFVDEFVLPQVVDPIRHVAKESINLVEASKSSAVETEENTVDSNTNNPNEAPLVPEELCNKPSSTGLCHSQQITSEISGHLIGERDSLINKTSDNTTEVNLNSSTSEQDGLINKTSDNTTEVNLNSSTGEQASLINKTSDNTTEVNLSSSTGERHSLINKTSDNTTEVNLNSSPESQSLENKSEEEGVLYDGSLCGDATAFEYSDWGIENIIDINLDTDHMTKEDPSMNLEKDTLLNSPVDELERDSNSSTTHQSSELEGAITCNVKKEENLDHIIAGDLSSEKLYESLNSAFKTSIVEPETIECNPTKTVDYLSLSPDIPSSCGSFTTLAYDSDSEAYVSCSGTGVADVSAINLEDTKNDTDVESCVIVEHGKLSGFSNPSRSKSYKKMIQDAFMSRKRITKEYKQLAILYGDIDKELCNTTKLSSKQPVQDLPDSEWELL